MERIKQALEKAKRGQQGDVLTAAAPSAGAPIAGVSIENLQYSRTPVVSLDRDHLERNRVVSFDKNDSRSVSFDVLRTQVLRKMDEKGWRTLAITSPTGGSGKSVVAINLAMSIAHQTNRTAMLVDFDLRKPKISSYLGISAEKSLNDVLRGDANVSEAMLNPELPRLVVLPTLGPVPKPAEVLSSGKVGALISDLRARYADRIVLFDLPPILGADDALAVLPQIDCVLLVVGEGMVTTAELKDSLRHLPSAKLLGTVLNKSTSGGKNYY